MPGKRYSINLPAHMAECDANYARLLQLFPGLKTEDVREFGVDLGDASVCLELAVLERSPYTTLVRLAQTEMDSDSWIGQPQITIRLYHDASCAEVVQYQHYRDFKAVYDYPNPAMHQRDEKVQVNRLLGELLAVCLHRGQVTALPLALSDN